MNCKACNEPVSQDDAFCRACGAKLNVICTSCGRECSAADAFCNGCGKQIDTVADAPAPTARSQSAGERRPLTVMFADLVGSTELSSQVDAEELMDALRLYQEMATDVIRFYDGYVAQYLGDGLLVYFGYPFAHEEDPARAVHTALEILRRLPDLNKRLSTELSGLGGRQLQIRIGIHSGPVVVTEIGAGARTEKLATGDTVNMAARLESLASPDRAVVSDATERLARGSFEFRPLGAHELKGFPAPVQIFQVDGVCDEPTATLARPGVVLTPLVGRADVVDRLDTVWREACAGKGRAFILEGEAGIGKSRLAQVLQKGLDSDAENQLSIQASALHQRSPFHPLLELLRRELGFSRADTSEEKLAKLGRAMAGSGYDNDTALALLADLLSIGTEQVKMPDLSQAEKRVATLRFLTEWVLSLSQARPLFILVEDLHWLDPSTLEWLGLFLEELQDAPVFLLMTTRPTFAAPWPEEQAEQIHLDVLAQSDLENLVRSMAGGVDLPAMLVTRLVERSGGVPLFAEELTRSVLDSMDDLLSAETFEIPDTLVASLTARLDRLGAAKELAQIASVVGRGFSQELIEAVAVAEGLEVTRALDTLVTSHFLDRKEDSTGVRYTFHHALLQDTAYQSILHRRCRDHHARVAEVLCKSFPDTAEKQPEVIAHHYDEAGLVDAALEQYELAGARATVRHANQEAVAHFRRGLELLLAGPESPERDHREIGFQIGLGLPLSIVTAYSEEDVGDCYRRALDLCRASEIAEPRFFEALYGLSRHHQVASELDAAVALGEELLQRSELTGALDERLAAHATLAQNLYWQGKFHRSLEHARATIDIYSPEESRTLWQVLGTDPQVAARAFASLSLWSLGDPEEALEISLQGIRLARELEHLQSEAYATGFTAILAIMMRDPELAMKMGTRAMQLGDEPRLPIFWGQGQVVRGWARVAGEEDPAGIEEVQQGIGLLASLHTGVGAPGFMSVLADVNARVGNHEVALGITAAGLATAAEKGQPQYVADLLTVRGLSQLALAGRCEDAAGKADGVAAAEASLREAVATAVDQDARSFGLRAWIALARCLVWQGAVEQIAEARAGLAAAYAGFEQCSGQEHEEARTLLTEI